MQEVIQKIVAFFRSVDIPELFETLVTEKQELLLIAGAVIFILLLSLWTIMERVQEKGWRSLIPLYRFVVLFDKVGMSPALALLLLIPGVNVILMIVFYFFLSKKFNRNYFFVLGLTVLPLLFYPIVAFGDGKCKHVKLKKHKEAKKSKAEARRDAMLQKKKQKAEKAAVKVSKKSGTYIETPVVEQVSPEEPALSMAELRIQREAARHPRATRSYLEYDPTEMTVKLGNASPAAGWADTMPSMGQGPKARDISKQKQIVEESRTEYERLLKQQQEAQKRRVRHYHPQQRTVNKTAAQRPRPITNQAVRVSQRPMNVTKRPAVTRSVRTKVTNSAPAKKSDNDVQVVRVVRKPSTTQQPKKRQTRRRILIN